MGIPLRTRGTVREEHGDDRPGPSRPLRSRGGSFSAVAPPAADVSVAARYAPGQSIPQCWARTMPAGLWRPSAQRRQLACDAYSHVTAKQTLDKLAREHYDRLFRAALFMCNDPSVAEDLIQETFLAAAGSLGGFQGRSSHYTWLYGILLNKFRGWLRSKGGAVSLHQLAQDPDGTDPLESLADNGPSAHEQMARSETARTVRGVLDELPPHHRSVLALRYLEDMSYEEIGATLGCSLGTVKSRIHYALLRIGAKMKRYEDWIT